MSPQRSEKIDRRWYEQIPCRDGGFIYLCSEDPPTLVLYTTQVKSARAIMGKIPGLQAEWMDGEAVIYFPPRRPGSSCRNGWGQKKAAGPAALRYGEDQAGGGGQGQQVLWQFYGAWGRDPARI